MAVAITVAPGSGDPSPARARAPAAPIPPAAETGRFNVGLFERCCDCTGRTCCSFATPCFPLAQILEKLVANGVAVPFGYNSFLAIYAFFVAITLTLSTVYNLPLFGMANAFQFVVLMLGRAAVRERYGIGDPGLSVEDCCAAWFCTPCSIIQLSHQLWRKPENLGCDGGKRVAFIA